MTVDASILDEFLELIKEAAPKTKVELKQTQKKEVGLWHNWNANGRKPEHLQPLLDSFKPVLDKHARVFTNSKVELPTSTIHFEVRKQFVNALKTYDPAKGTQLNTWVQTNLQKTSRFVKTYQNLGKIPESQISGIRKFNESKAHLTDKFGHEPDTRSMADHLGWSHKRVVQLQKELSRKDLPASAFMIEPAESLSAKELEAVTLMQYGLTPEERTVYEYTFGMNGRPMLKPGQISSTAKIHPSKVSRIRNKLQGKLQDTMQYL